MAITQTLPDWVFNVDTLGTLSRIWFKASKIQPSQESHDSTAETVLFEIFQAAADPALSPALSMLLFAHAPKA